jgi:hypothetical protein
MDRKGDETQEAIVEGAQSGVRAAYSRLA